MPAASLGGPAAGALGTIGGSTGALAGMGGGLLPAGSLGGPAASASALADSGIHLGSWGQKALDFYNSDLGKQGRGLLSRMGGGGGGQEQAPPAMPNVSAPNIQLGDYAPQRRGLPGFQPYRHTQPFGGLS